MAKPMAVTATAMASSTGQPVLLNPDRWEVALEGGLSELIILLNRVTRSLAETPSVVVPLLLSATSENCRTPLFLLVVILSSTRLSTSSRAILGILISSPIISQFHPMMMVSLLYRFMNPFSSVVP